jgi:hypothetical protein
MFMMEKIRDRQEPNTRFALNQPLNITHTIQNEIQGAEAESGK